MSDNETLDFNAMAGDGNLAFEDFAASLGRMMVQGLEQLNDERKAVVNAWTPRGFRPPTVTRRVETRARKTGKSNPTHTPKRVCVGLFPYRATHVKRAISPGHKKPRNTHPLATHPPSRTVRFTAGAAMIVAALLFAEVAL